MAAMNHNVRIVRGPTPVLVSLLLLTVFACATDHGSDATTQPTTSSESSSPASPTAAPTPSNAPSFIPDGTAQATEDVKFVATEEQGTKAWKASPSNTTISLKNRGDRPLVIKAVNTLSTEHGFAIDSMKVKEVLKPGEEKTITVPLENIDRTMAEHRVYCQLHPKHMATTLVFITDQSENIQSSKDTPGKPSGEVSLRPLGDNQTSSGETGGQRLMREQTQQQPNVSSSAADVQAPGSIAPLTCEGFPGFDRGCPRSGK